MAGINGINQTTNSFCKTASNLSDVASPATSRSNLGFTNSLVKFSATSLGTYVLASGTAISASNVIPQNTQGGQVMTMNYTPLNSANTLEIEVVLQASGLAAADTQLTAALFQNAIADAIASCGGNSDTSGSRIVTLAMKKIMTAGTTSAITFNVRLGASDGSDCYLNGQTGAQSYGGVSASTIIIREYA